MKKEALGARPATKWPNLNSRGCKPTVARELFDPCGVKCVLSKPWAIAHGYWYSVPLGQWEGDIGEQSLRRGTRRYLSQRDKCYLRMKLTHGCVTLPQ